MVALRSVSPSGRGVGSWVSLPTKNPCTIGIWAGVPVTPSYTASRQLCKRRKITRSNSGNQTLKHS